MIVRIVNGKQDWDRFYDCVTSFVSPDLEGEQDGSFMIVLHFAKGIGDQTFNLTEGDEIYYMNNEGKTLAIDRRMCKPLSK